MNRSSSFRRTLCPMPRTSSASVAIPSSSARGAGRCGHALAHLLAGSLNRLHDVHVAGAATDVARDGPADLVLARALVVLQEGRPHEHHAWRAEPALQPVLLLERLLDRMQRAVGR